MSAAAQRQIVFEPQMVELAGDAGVTLAAAEELYRVEMERLRRSARVLDFVPLLATKRLERELRGRRRDQHAVLHPDFAEPSNSPLPEPSTAANAVPREARASAIESNGAAWSRHDLEDFERTLTLGELTRQDGARRREIVALLKAAREDPKRFARFGDNEQELMVRLIDRFDGFC
jgi:Protein of unknown function (DUF3562)